MEDFTLTTLIAVFEEMFGRALFWLMVAAALVISALFVWVLLRERSLKAWRLVRSQIWAPLGGALAIGFVLWITNSRLADIGGPIDWIVLLGIFLAGGVGFSILVYVVQALLRPARGSE